METYYYECPVCGFVHQVPAYWVSFAPEEEMEYQHLCLETKEVCENEILKLKNN